MFQNAPKLNKNEQFPPRNLFAAQFSGGSVSTKKPIVTLFNKFALTVSVSTKKPILLAPVSTKKPIVCLSENAYLSTKKPTVSVESLIRNAVLNDEVCKGSIQMRNLHNMWRLGYVFLTLTFPSLFQGPQWTLSRNVAGQIRMCEAGVILVLCMHVPKCSKT